MYSRQNRNGQGDVQVELPRDYSGNAFTPFVPIREPKEACAKIEAKEEKCPEREECPCSSVEPAECGKEKSPSLGLSGLKGILGGNIGLEELLLLGVIFLIFTDNELRDSELLICLLLILFI
jgi:hypothetical protein